MLIQPLKFHKKQKNIHVNNQCCGSYPDYGLKSPNDSYLPFIIKRESKPYTNLNAVVLNYGAGLPVPSGNFPQLELKCTTLEDGIYYDWFVYDGSLTPSINQPGCYQIFVTFDSEEPFVSEVFCVCDWGKDDSPCIKLEYKSECSELGIPYSDFGEDFGFYFWFNDDVVWGLPQIEEEIEAEQDNFGRDIILNSKYVTRYILESGNIPFYLAESIISANLHDEMFLIEPDGCRVDLIDVEIEHEPNEDGCFHEVNLSFKLDEDLVSGSCCDEVKKLQCFECGNGKEIISIVQAQDKTTIEALPPSVDDVYYITQGGTPTDNEWNDNVHSLATWNGIKWIYSKPENGSFGCVGGVPLVYSTAVLDYVTPFFLTNLSGTAPNHNIAGIGIDGYFYEIQILLPSLVWFPIKTGLSSELVGGVDFNTGALNPTDVRVRLYTSIDCPDVFGQTFPL